MSRFNYYLQVTLLIITAVFAILSLLKKDFLLFVVSLQFLVGVLQILVAIVLLLNKRTRSQGLILHLILSCLLIVFLIAFGPKLWLLTFTLPWLLAINFCRISYQLYIKNLGT